MTLDGPEAKQDQSTGPPLRLPLIGVGWNSEANAPKSWWFAEEKQHLLGNTRSRSE